MKMKIDHIDRYDISRPKSRQGHNYSKYVSQHDDAYMY